MIMTIVMKNDALRTIMILMTVIMVMMMMMMMRQTSTSRECRIWFEINHLDNCADCKNGNANRLISQLNYSNEFMNCRVSQLYIIVISGKRNPIINDKYN